MERESFVFYKSFFDAIKELPKEDRLECFMSICQYALYGEEIKDLSNLARAIFFVAKPNLDANNKRYTNGKSGGRPKEEKPMVIEDNKNKKPMVIKKLENKKPNVNVNENDNVNVNDNVNENEDIKENAPKGHKRKQVFTPPTLPEVRNYCAERGNRVDAERFVDFYTSKGWYVGKTKMKDWQAAVRTWEKQDAERGASAQGGNIFADIAMEGSDYF